MNHSPDIESYALGDQLGKKGWYIETWRATDEWGADVVVKIHRTRVSDDYLGSPSHDLTAPIAATLPHIERLLSLGESPGVAPWARCNFHPERAHPLLCRSPYPERLRDRFRGDPTRTRAGDPDP